MVRRFSDPVEVRVGTRVIEGEGDERLEDVRPDPPEAFIWRGRLYVVRTVLSQWRERRAWWREALDADEADVVPGASIAAAASEQRIWRVEASPGWSFVPGVYDLAHDESPHATDRGEWSLVRVSD